MTTNPSASVAQPHDTDTILRAILRDVLGLSDERVAELDADSGLFGHIPEFDSMAVAGLLTEVEDRCDILIEDDEVDGDMLETYGALLTFVNAKRAAG
ncbi:acyl carrier protein [Aurantiacibacter suaedae]|uniref:acyl carrier protein n=1 Tax=Aurantiacibacter suaedae TaxID=2545755 RepID=UPI0010F98E7C|nr:phosphopantetheine-binding protein [Aurantiacibacter suaedae]